MRTSRHRIGSAPSTPLQHSRAAQEMFTSHLAVIQRVIASVVRRHQLSAADAEEFRSVVYLRLIEHDYRALRQFQHRSSIRTFLNVVIERLYLDFRNHEWGKWRPSAKARRLGREALLLERLIARDGFTLSEAVEILRCQHGVTLPPAELSALGAGVRARPLRQPADLEGLLELRDAGPLADELVARAQSARRAVATCRALARAVAALPPVDRQLIDLRFREGRTVAEIARTLRMDQKQLYRRLAQLLTGLRQALEADAAVADLARTLAKESWPDLDAAFSEPLVSKVA
jgi:RNA polymerase sigma factor (sigma-70 family)